MSSLGRIEGILSARERLVARTANHDRVRRTGNALAHAVTSASDGVSSPDSPSGPAMMPFSVADIDTTTFGRSVHR